MLCKSCHLEGTGKYCSNCGQSLTISKITIPALLHEIFHLFTHLDRGILLTLKSLAHRPGLMQREYLRGDRIRHQKPFAMFFVSASTLALGFYWINYTIINYLGAGEASEVVFFNKYLLILVLLLIPISTTIVYLFFYNSGFGFAEIGVMQMYKISFLLLLLLLIQLLKFIWPELETRYIELPVAVLYGVLTFYNFFDYQKKWIIIVKSVVSVLIYFIIITELQDRIIDQYLK